MHASERNLASAVVHLEKQYLPAERHVDRFEDDHVCGKTDAPAWIQPGAVQIEYGAVSRMLGVDFEPGFAGQFFVSPGVAERLSVGDQFAFLDVEPDEFRLRRKGDEQGGAEND